MHFSATSWGLVLAVAFLEVECITRYEDLCIAIQENSIQAVISHRQGNFNARDEAILRGITVFEEARKLDPKQTQVKSKNTYLYELICCMLRRITWRTHSVWYLRQHKR